MKHLYSAILAVVLFCAACNQAKPFQIDGTFDTADGEEVYLINLEVPDGGDTLSVTAVQGGKFVFTGKVEKPFYAYVGTAKRRVRMILFAPDGTIIRRDLRGEQIYTALEEILK